ncbi:MAG: Hsp20/alpha crystallin family protein [Bdellovibrionota bacterium]
MTLVKFSPFRRNHLDRWHTRPSIDSLWSEVNDLFDHFQSGTAKTSSTFGFVPAVDIKESEKEITLHAELPGLTEKDVELTIHDGVLTIKGEKKYETKKENENNFVVERSFGTFSRSFALPTEVEEEKVQAKFAKGVLNVTLPKSTTVTSQKKITIQGE